MMKPITRREFLKLSASLTAAAMLPKNLFAIDKPIGPVIAVAYGERSKLVKGAVDILGGITTFIQKGDVVCVKPNISFAARRNTGATTSVDIVTQVVQLCLDAGASKVIVIDHTIADAQLCVERSNIQEAIINKKVSLLTPTKERQFTEIEVPRGRELKSTKIAKAIIDADKLINVPIAKSHSGTGVSLGLKNLMGLVWDRAYFHNTNLHQTIAELATVIKPHLTIIDATQVLTSGGPGGPGKTVALNTVIAGTDIVAVDSYTVGITQWYDKSFIGRNVKHIAAAAELGLGEIDTNAMTVKAVSV